jgi:hypothetical protein
VLLLDQADRTLAIRGLADDVDASFLEQPAQPGAVDLVVVDQQYAGARS